ncbi:MAG: NAD(+)/NADH kinase [Muribaculum sp.]|nr:NAD(+)/NADH kinase [Muribaculum sp.]
MKAKRLALYGKSRQNENLTQIIEFLAEAHKMGFGLMCHEKFADYLLRNSVGPALVPEVFSGIPDADAAVSFGGDGTVLRTARRLSENQIPIAGVNTGTLGYLAHFTLDNPDILLSGLLHDTLKTQPRNMISVRGHNLPEGFICEALNEVAVMKDDSASMINVNVHLDGFFLANYQADGLIVSTATGSTAYNLSVGGPILQPELDCMVLSPVAPHSLTLRPIVISGNSRLHLEMSSRTGSFRLSVDGYSCTLKEGDNLEIEPSGRKVTLLSPPDDTFAFSLREKLLWGRN